MPFRRHPICSFAPALSPDVLDCSVRSVFLKSLSTTPICPARRHAGVTSPSTNWIIGSAGPSHPKLTELHTALWPVYAPRSSSLTSYSGNPPAGRHFVELLAPEVAPRVAYL